MWVGETKMGLMNREILTEGVVETAIWSDLGAESVILENVQVVCSDCGVETEVPFKSIEGHPVDYIDCQPKYRKYTKKL